jgi:hypothetical protein
MAYQLIYTSAPRCQEAGRSGFGTVARHRGISPLLVSVIERASQFSRLPGTDSDRVIFCHRIINLGAAKFHLLSAIRDAGADYTGRTNHIAHHLVVEPREIAQLGTSCPSPAQILLNMPWATSWNDTPRYLADSEEVSLASLRSTLSSNAWAYLCGSPDQGWLLSSGEASRGAYLVHHPATDLREIFDESLRLIPDRLWQISFTTALQPSDEVSDFRWIGVEEQSPMRAKAEVSGRAILNLADPSSLPRIEAPQQAAALPVFPAPPPTVSEQEAPGKAMPDAFEPDSVAVFPTASQRAVPTQYVDRPGAAQTRRTFKTKRSIRPIAISAFVLIIAVCLWMKAEEDSRKAFETEIDKHTHLHKEFCPWVEQLKDEVESHGKSSRQEALEIAKFIGSLLNNINSQAFDQIEVDLEKYTSIERRQINVPTELNKLTENSKNYLLKYKEVSGLKTISDSLSILDKVESVWPLHRKEDHTNAVNPLFQKLENKLTEISNEKRREAMEHFLCVQNSDIAPSISRDILQKRYPFLKEKSTVKSGVFQNAKNIVEIWEMVDSPPNNKDSEKKALDERIDRLEKGGARLPNWLRNRVDERFSKETPKPKEATVPAAAPVQLPTATPPPQATATAVSNVRVYHLGTEQITMINGSGIPIRELQGFKDWSEGVQLLVKVNGADIETFKYRQESYDFSVSFDSDSPEFKIESSNSFPKLKHVGKGISLDKFSSTIELTIPQDKEPTRFKLFGVPVPEAKPATLLIRQGDKVKPAPDLINSLGGQHIQFSFRFKPDPKNEKYYKASDKLERELDFSISKSLVDKGKTKIDERIAETEKKLNSLKLPPFTLSPDSWKKATGSLLELPPPQRDTVNTFFKSHYAIELIVVKEANKIELCDRESQQFRDSLHEINKLFVDGDKKKTAATGKPLSKEDQEKENQKSQVLSILNAPSSSAPSFKSLIRKLHDENSIEKEKLEKGKESLKRHLESLRNESAELGRNPYRLDRVPPGAYEIVVESGIEGSKAPVSLYKILVP